MPLRAGRMPHSPSSPSLGQADAADLRMGEPFRRDCLRYGRIDECSRVGKAVRADLPAARGIEGRDGCRRRSRGVNARTRWRRLPGSISPCGTSKAKPRVCRSTGENRPIFTYATGGYYRPDALDADYGRELAQFIELGYPGVKLKTGAGTVAAEARRIGAVRRAIGDEALLML